MVWRWVTRRDRQPPPGVYQSTPLPCLASVCRHQSKVNIRSRTVGNEMKRGPTVKKGASKIRTDERTGPPGVGQTKFTQPTQQKLPPWASSIQQQQQRQSSNYHHNNIKRYCTKCKYFQKVPLMPESERVPTTWRANISSRRSRHNKIVNTADAISSSFKVWNLYF